MGLPVGCFFLWSSDPSAQIWNKMERGLCIVHAAVSILLHHCLTAVSYPVPSPPARIPQRVAKFSLGIPIICAAGSKVLKPPEL